LAFLFQAPTLKQLLLSVAQTLRGGCCAVNGIGLQTVVGVAKWPIAVLADIHAVDGKGHESPPSFASMVEV